MAQPNVELLRAARIVKGLNAKNQEYLDTIAERDVTIERLQAANNRIHGLEEGMGQTREANGALQEANAALTRVNELQKEKIDHFEGEAVEELLKTLPLEDSSPPGDGADAAPDS